MASLYHNKNLYKKVQTEGKLVVRLLDCQVEKIEGIEDIDLLIF